MPATDDYAPPVSFVRVERRLARYRKLTMDRLLADLPTGTPRYLYDLVPDYPRRAGKGLRASLCLAVCQTLGGALADAIPLAVAVELFHNAFLIHDDAQDGSERRRGLPTLHAQHGLGIAINVGNAMNLLALGQLNRCRSRLGPRRAAALAAFTQEMLRHSLEGQGLELQWIRDNVCELRERDYYRMCLKKTSWYTCIYPSRAGALAAGDADVHRFDRFGWYLGAAFQIQDDLLNLVGDEGKYGKETAGDLREGKRTLMIIHLLRHANRKTRTRLERYLAKDRGQRTGGEVTWLLERLHDHGSLDHARRCARRLAGAALREIRVASNGLPDSEEKEFLHQLVYYVIQRDR
jgi:geranylgeranyl diphosphate synthase type II